MSIHLRALHQRALPESKHFRKKYITLSSLGGYKEQKEKHQDKQQRRKYKNGEKEKRGGMENETRCKLQGLLGPGQEHPHSQETAQEGTGHLT